MDNILEIQKAKTETLESIEHISAVSQQTASSSLAITVSFSTVRDHACIYVSDL